ncbi:transcriptional regulator [[Phormidium ambiguum] IAM M-71]|uniref:Transcriptional regulator n=1 Tax=[Phormidium ambiguum] IAM M-71 TaxID=454136 RepID=A0A1U7IU71_9CYAN|nr:transcriptional regulator [Phormidium ambiguum]OKH40989.1 transcriptional regulator [Phormidium ambiguum IAM M-71]
MKDVKVPTSRSYREFLIESLKNPERSAAYIEAVLELEEESPDPELLRAVLKDVIEAQINNNLSESTKQLHEKLDRILTESNATEIYTFVELLNELGFQLTITPKETQS